ncbi:MAG: hypothetical protein K8U57_03960 [Planctomycetes bacterium]|nr:hypothetical protein [Planctomycetota bacterium]
MLLFTLLLVASAPTISNAAPAPREAGPSVKEVRAALEKSIPFLEKSSATWKNDRKCVSCHQVPFTIWALNDAKEHGFAVDSANFEGLTKWAFEFCTTNQDKGAFTGGFHLTMAFMTLSQSAAAPREDAMKAFAFFEPLFAKRQKPNGSWREGNQVKVAGAEREADEVDTMWTILAIRTMEKLGDKLPEATQKAIAGYREKAMAFLKDAKPGKRVDWVALRYLVARECGTPAEAAGFLQELRSLQNADGGWGYVRGGVSYPHTTGECLYALGIAGLTGDTDTTVCHAWKYLVKNQWRDGSWDAVSRANFSTKPEKQNEVTIHWGTGFATIGLLKTLPK